MYWLSLTLAFFLDNWQRIEIKMLVKLNQLKDDQWVIALIVPLIYSETVFYWNKKLQFLTIPIVKILFSQDHHSFSCIFFIMSHSLDNTLDLFRNSVLLNEKIIVSYHTNCENSFLTRSSFILMWLVIRIIFTVQSFHAGFTCQVCHVCWQVFMHKNIQRFKKSLLMISLMKLINKSSCSSIYNHYSNTTMFDIFIKKIFQIPIKNSSGSFMLITFCLKNSC